MRFAISVERYDPRRGGVEVAARHLLEELAARGHEVDLLSLKCAAELPPRARWRAVCPSQPVLGLRSWAFGRAVAHHLTENHYDLSVSVGCVGAYSEDVVWAQDGTRVGMRAGRVRAIHHSRWRRWRREIEWWVSPRLRLYSHLENRLFRRRPPPLVIAVSERVAAECRRFYGLPSERVRVIHNHNLVDRARFNLARMQGLRASSRSALELGDEDLAILFAGMDPERKGLRPLIKALAQLPAGRGRVLLLVAGPRAESAAPYQRLAQRLGCGERVRFVSHQSRLEELYAAADVFCLPTFQDPCAIVTGEAMACGLPVITSRYDGFAEIIEHGIQGFVLAEPGDESELRQALLSLFDGNLRRAMGTAAAQKLAEMPAMRPAAEVANLLEDWVRERKGAPSRSVEIRPARG